MSTLKKWLTVSRGLSPPFEAGNVIFLSASFLHNILDLEEQTYLSVNLDQPIRFGWLQPKEQMESFRTVRVASSPWKICRVGVADCSKSIGSKDILRLIDGSRVALNVVD